MSLQYNPSNCVACGACQRVCLLGVEAIPSVNPLIINDNCLDCGACEAKCPEGKAVLRSDLDYLLPNFVSVFGDLKPKNEPTTPTTPANPKDNTGSEGKDTTQGQPSENPKENPSQNPSDKDKDKGDSSKTESSQDKSESSTNDKDTKNDTDKSDEKSESSTSESSTKSEFIPTPPPPTQITSSIKVLQEINSLQRYLATIK